MVAKWTEIDMPWIESEEFVDAVIDKISILDILDKWGVEYELCNSGSFTHRMKCPLPIHLQGGERTASMFISEESNTFHCFGCSSGGNIANLISLYEGRPFHESLRCMGKLAGITTVDDEQLLNTPKKEKKDPEKTRKSVVFRTGVLIRDFVEISKGKREYNKWCKWANDKFFKLDGYLDRLEDEDWEIAKSYHDSILNFIKSKT
jgi:hypothetical protein